MQASTLSPGRGWRWLIEGFALFRRNPAPLCFLALGYYLATTVVWAIPMVGRWACFLLIPAFSVSLMNACRLIDRKEALPRQLLFSGFYRNLQTLLVLGAVYALIMVLVLSVSMSSDFRLSFDVPAADGAPAGEASDPATLSISLLGGALLIPVGLVFNFAPVLAAWHDMSAGKALFFSLVACLRNWRPFLLYLLALTMVTFVGMCALLVIGSLFGSSAGPLSVMMVVAVGLVLLPIVWHASFYVGYRDIFLGRRDAP
jgi:hypothetical protein